MDLPVTALGSAGVSPRKWPARQRTTTYTICRFLEVLRRWFCSISAYTFGFGFGLGLLILQREQSQKDFSLFEENFSTLLDGLYGLGLLSRCWWQQHLFFREWNTKKYFGHTISVCHGAFERHEGVMKLTVSKENKGKRREKNVFRSLVLFPLRSDE